jgi:citrate lyase subunit beta-like protein
MLEKSLAVDSDMLVYDLEDSVPPSPEDKNRARERLQKFLSVRLFALYCTELTIRTETRSSQTNARSGESECAQYTVFS